MIQVAMTGVPLWGLVLAIFVAFIFGAMVTNLANFYNSEVAIIKQTVATKSKEEGEKESIGELRMVKKVLGNYYMSDLSSRDHWVREGHMVEKHKREVDKIVRGNVSLQSKHRQEVARLISKNNRLVKKNKQLRAMLDFDADAVEYIVLKGEKLGFGEK